MSQEPIETTDLIDSIKLWFEKAVPNPKDKNLTTQIGCHWEEIAETMEKMLPALTDETQRRKFNDLLGCMKTWAACFKSGTVQFDPTLMDRVGVFDGLCDTVVTSVGVAHMARMDVFAGLDEVDQSNWSKFDMLGNPLFDENQKIIKGPGYFKPELSGYV